MIVGETITVLHPSTDATDPFGAPIKEFVEESVENVVIHPAEPSDYTDTNRPDGALIQWVLHFPKSYTASLRECRVVVRGETYDIEGDPMPYMNENTPTPWNRRAYAMRLEG